MAGNREKFRFSYHPPISKGLAQPLHTAHADRIRIPKHSPCDCAFLLRLLVDGKTRGAAAQRARSAGCRESVR